MRKHNQRIALTVTPDGVDAISFLSEDRREALEFYQEIQAEIEDFQQAILKKVNCAKGKNIFQ